MKRDKLIGFSSSASEEDDLIAGIDMAIGVHRGACHGAVATYNAWCAPLVLVVAALRLLGELRKFLIE
ncbi:hypothetical protein [Rhodoferax sp.]|uniref:hypothetical protein n=1 Tax=Rhodoferax sp. TaxID=50421 RepID=UPI00276E11CD|nr:hypothetical protein [Rhodoferax sp.]